VVFVTAVKPAVHTAAEAGLVYEASQRPAMHRRSALLVRDSWLLVDFSYGSGRNIDWRGFQCAIRTQEEITWPIARSSAPKVPTARKNQPCAVLR